MIWKLICRVMGHKWRRLRKSEHQPQSMAALASYSNLRICRRCGAERIAAKRKTKQEA